MALRDIDDKGNAHDVVSLPHQREFNQTWLRMTSAQRTAIEEEIDRRLDELSTSPSPKWDSITNTSIEGSRTGKGQDDWTGTVFEPILESCGMSKELANMFY